MSLADRIWNQLWTHEGLEPRASQTELALDIRRTFESTSSSIGLFEAPTGMGKSLAYLVEGFVVARTRRTPIWIATPRRDLQQQLLQDAALLTKAVTALHVDAPKMTVLQGIEHTLCHALVSHQPSALQATIHTWLADHPTGELDQLPDTIPRDTVSMSATGCHAERCAFYESCFAHQARRQVPTQDLIITNHALLASTIRRPFLPTPTMVIVDEAHVLERSIRHTLTFQCSVPEIERHADVFSRHLPRTQNQRVARTAEALTALRHELRTCHINLTDQLSTKPKTLLPLFGGKLQTHPMAHKVMANAQAVLFAIRAVLKTLPPLEHDRHIDAHRLHIIRQELMQAEQNLAAFCQGAFDQYGLLRTERQGIGFLRIPHSIHHYARKRLWDPLRHGVLLSGTLATSNSDPFSATRGSLGIPGTTPTARNPFPTQRTLIERVFLPTWTPDLSLNVVPATFPRVFLSRHHGEMDEELYAKGDDSILNPDWLDATSRIIAHQDAQQAGGIVVLSTSYSMQEAIIKQLGTRLTRPTIIQHKHQMPNALTQYLAVGPRAIFFTVAGWDGMDLPNSLIQALFILKLPLQAHASTTSPSVFEPPLTIQTGRSPARRIDTHQYYIQIQRPAIINFRQAYGRVIRTPHDSGTIWVMDPRLADPGTQSLFFGGATRRYLYPSTTVTMLSSAITTEAA